MSEPVTIERLERGLAILAYCIERDGPVVVPLFERLERELAALRQTQDTVGRAKRLLENLRSSVGLATSALPSEADIRASLQHGCFVPILLQKYFWVMD
jgi:hypothetical protein